MEQNKCEIFLQDEGDSLQNLEDSIDEFFSGIDCKITSTNTVADESGRLIIVVFYK